MRDRLLVAAQSCQELSRAAKNFPETTVRAFYSTTTSRCQFWSQRRSVQPYKRMLRHDTYAKKVRYKRIVSQYQCRYFLRRVMLILRQQKNYKPIKVHIQKRKSLMADADNLCRLIVGILSFVCITYWIVLAEMWCQKCHENLVVAWDALLWSNYFIETLYSRYNNRQSG